MSDASLLAPCPADPNALGVPTRLLVVLDRLLRGRVAVVSGPAGHGKLALVQTWLNHHPELDVHWLEEPSDLAAAERSLEHPAKRKSVLVVSSRKLVQDHDFVTQLLDLAEREPSVRVVFVGRTRPDAPLGSLAARALLVDVDGDALAYTNAEVAELLQHANTDLAPGVLEKVMDYIQGWPAIARMLSHEPISWSHTAKVTRLADSYVEDEVLRDLSPDDVEMLQELSPLTTLDPLAAAWMTGRGDAAAQLSRLQAHGVPISWDDANTIRLNPVLRGFLGRQMAKHSPEIWARLNERAALWLRNRNRQFEAIELAMTSAQPGLAWMLAGEYLTSATHRPELRECLSHFSEILPPGWDRDICLHVARGLGTPQAMLAQIDALHMRLESPENDTARFGYSALVLSMARSLGYPKDLDLTPALQMATGVDPDQVHELDKALLSAMHTEHGLWLLHHGHPARAEETLLAGLGLARVMNVPWATVTTLSTLAFLTAERGDVASAVRLAEDAVTACAETVFDTDALDEFALLARAVTAIDTGDMEAAGQWLGQIARRRDRLTENDAIRTYVQALFEVNNGNSSAARRLVEAYRDQPRTSSTVTHRLLVSLAAFDAAIAQNDVDVATEEFERIQELHLPPEATGEVVLEARLALARGDSRTAHALLAPLVETDGPPFEHAKHTLYMLMIFGVAADNLNRADEALRAFQRAGVLADRLGLNTPNALHTRVAVASRRDVPLTEAERHVLAQLDSGKTLSETAEELFISLNTLKTHLRRIYKKLGVANREEAIDRAQVMGLRG
ncbi:helix-turn-helix transcriptional regulator [Luteococcus sp. Sow4_B9]|uniref:helix-turn-helix transcriptional regulator n=1 Tax=Luteococcus sp. Sow4_B9 TaxID=3438792 RepID=UPI003F9DCB5F